jgi:hypothetical protein
LLDLIGHNSLLRATSSKLRTTIEHALKGMVSVDASNLHFLASVDGRARSVHSLVEDSFRLLSLALVIAPKKRSALIGRLKPSLCTVDTTFQPLLHGFLRLSPIPRFVTADRNPPQYKEQAKGNTPYNRFRASPYKYAKRLLQSFVVGVVHLLRANDNLHRAQHHTKKRKDEQNNWEEAREV